MCPGYGRQPPCLIRSVIDATLNLFAPLRLARGFAAALHILDISGNYHADRIFSVAQSAIEPLVLDFLRRHTPAKQT